MPVIPRRSLLTPSEQDALPVFATTPDRAAIWQRCGHHNRLSLAVQ